MKKIIINTIIIALVITGLNSCRKGDDLYVSPNSPLVVTPATMLSGVEVGTFNNLEGGAVKIAAIFMQNSSGVVGQAVQPEQYQPIESDMDNYWNGLYTNMNNCKLLSDTYGAKDPYYKGIAEVLLAMNLGLATDMWGDVPYSEAFQGATAGNFTPHFDQQQNVLASIQTLLSNAISDLGTSASANTDIPSTADFIYGGNTAAWIKTAWTLKARYYMRLSKKTGVFDPNVVLTDLTNGIASNADNCYAIHGTGGSEQNQWSAYLQSRGYIVASQVLIDSMGNMADPRTPYYFDTTGMGNMAVGNALGQFNTSVSNWGPYLGGFDNTGTPNAAKNIVLVSYAEALFLKAEAEKRASLNATADLNAAITASIAEVTGGAGGANPIVYYDSTTTIHTIILEKWKAMFANPVESYSDYRRTTFPALTPNPVALLTFIPRRLPTSEQERTLNPNAPTPALSVPVWYAQ